MRCKYHVSDFSSTIGVCASCLREKLLPLQAAQNPPLIFPQSVSPPRLSNPSNLLFFSTPQLGTTNHIPSRREKNKFNFLSSLFRSRSEVPRSSSWLSGLFSGRKKQETNVPGERARGFPGRGRGMSPARVSDCGPDEAFYSGFFSATATPRGTVKRRGGASRGLGSQNVATFCLSPLVWASPKRQWTQKMETQVADVRPHLSTAALFCANRSRKMADFGRFGRRQ